MSDQSEAPAQQYLTFALGAEMFGIDIRGIKEIIEYGGLTTVPMMPGFIRGVINLRGAVVPVVDLSVRFGREPTVLGRRTCIVIIEVASDTGWKDMGVVVDAVSEVLQVASTAIEPPPSFGMHMATDAITGMCMLDDGFVILLDAQRALDAGNVEPRAVAMEDRAAA